MYQQVLVLVPPTTVRATKGLAALAGRQAGRGAGSVRGPSRLSASSLAEDAFDVTRAAGVISASLAGKRGPASAFADCSSAPFSTGLGVPAHYGTREKHARVVHQ